ncbi:hypothetical protein [Sulfitobacter sediminilitoris]|nr:hypothetical protein [Sulfitobacter sediminilitoris]
MKRHMRYQRAAKKIPAVLSAEEVARILEAAPGPGLRYRAAFSVAYGGGLRASEVTHLAPMLTRFVSLMSMRSQKDGQMSPSQIL